MPLFLAVLLLLAVAVTTCGRRHHIRKGTGLLIGESDDDIRDNVFNYDEQGGGEEDEVSHTAAVFRFNPLNSLGFQMLRDRLTWALMSLSSCVCVCVSHRTPLTLTCCGIPMNPPLAQAPTTQRRVFHEASSRSEGTPHITCPPPPTPGGPPLTPLTSRTTSTM